MNENTLFVRLVVSAAVYHELQSNPAIEIAWYFNRRLVAVLATPDKIYAANYCLDISRRKYDELVRAHKLCRITNSSLIFIEDFIHLEFEARQSSARDIMVRLLEDIFPHDILNIVIDYSGLGDKTIIYSKHNNMPIFVVFRHETLVARGNEKNITIAGVDNVYEIDYENKLFKWRNKSYTFDNMPTFGRLILLL